MEESTRPVEESIPQVQHEEAQDTGNHEPHEDARDIGNDDDGRKVHRSNTSIREENENAEQLNRLADLSEAERFAMRDAEVWVGFLATDPATGRMEHLTFRFYQCCVAELIGTLFLVFIGGLAVIGGRGSVPILHGEYIAEVSASEITNITLGYGVALAIAVYCTFDMSGGNLNPAVSLALALRGKISVVRFLFYSCFQLIGAMIGAAILKGIIPPQFAGGLGVTEPSEDVTLAEAVALEGLFTMLLVFVVLSITYPESNNRFSAPMMIGLALFVIIIGGGPWTGGSANPARSFGPAVATGNYEYLWIYWVGPLWGSVTMAVIYDILFINVFQIDRVKKMDTNGESKRARFFKAVMSTRQSFISAA